MLEVITILFILVVFGEVLIEFFNFDKNKYYRAIKLAEFGHKDQKRKFTGEPYFVHPVAVHDLLVSVLDYPCFLNGKKISSETYWKMKCASILHDTLEDCPNISHDDIIFNTDYSVLNLVCELTNPSKNSTLSRAERKALDREHLKAVSWEAKFIKLCDRICNLLDLIRECSDKKFMLLYATESRLLLEALKDTNPYLEGLLSATICEIELENSN